MLLTPRSEIYWNTGFQHEDWLPFGLFHFLCVFSRLRIRSQRSGPFFPVLLPASDLTLELHAVERVNLCRDRAHSSC